MVKSNGIKKLAGGLVTSDDSHVWRYGNLVPGADPQTFKVFGGIDGIYAKDKNHAYVDSKDGYEIIPSADPASFKALDFGYAKDSKNFYSKGRPISGIGGKFTVNECGFLIGEGAVYHYGFKLPVDAKSFKVLNLQEKLKSTNPFLGNFEIQDKNGKYIFKAGGFENEFKKINQTYV